MRTAFSLIGYPYVWGGENEKVEPGFDCSGYVWRVFKLASYADAPGLSNTLKGRTAAQMALEVPRSERIHRADLEPGDVLFFRPTPKAKAAQIDHTSIYLGNGWMIESAGQGVSIGRLDWFDKTVRMGATAAGRDRARGISGAFYERLTDGGSSSPVALI